MKTIKKAVVALGMVAAAVAPMMAAPMTYAADADYFTPARTGYKLGSEPARAVLNSVTDNNQGNANAIGDERKFVRIYDAEGKLVSDRTLEAGKEYEVYVFFRNDANNTSAVAEDVRLSMSFPAYLAKDAVGDLKGTITSTKTEYPTITSTVKIKAAENMAVQYKVGSSKRYTQYAGTATTAVDLPENELFSSRGTLLGLTASDGRLVGGAGNSGHVSFTIMTTKSDGPISGPTTTPNTGPTEVLVGIACVLAVGGGAGMWFMTRRSATKAMRQAKGRK